MEAGRRSSALKTSCGLDGYHMVSNPGNREEMCARCPDLRSPCDSKHIGWPTGVNMQESHRWGVILAGGDGKRLLPLTRRITGDDRPKQFCALTGGETLLKQTRRRVAQIIPEPQTLLILTRTHERYYA